MIRCPGILRWMPAASVVGAAGYLAGSAGTDLTRALMFGAATGLVAMLIWLLATTATPLASQVGQIDMRDRLTEELYRSRRRGHPLALVRLALSDDLEVHQELRAHIRQMDHIEIDGERASLLLPEASRSEAERLVGRLHAAVPAAFRDSTPVIAVFPEDGVTERALAAAVGGRPFFAEALGNAGLPDADASRPAPDADRAGSERPAAG